MVESTFLSNPSIQYEMRPAREYCFPGAMGSGSGGTWLVISIRKSSLSSSAISL